MPIAVSVPADNLILSAGITCAPLTRGPKHHFFGYYDKCPWDPTGRYLLGLEVDFIDRPPASNDIATVGVIDLQGDKSFRAVEQTRAWNWQQGTMLQWLKPEGKEQRRIAYNIVHENQYRTAVRDLDTGDTRLLPLPIYCVSRDGRWALSVNYGRLATQRPGYGYVALPDPFAGQPAPAEDGLWLMDMHGGEHRLIVSLKQLAELRPLPTMAGATHRIYAVEFGPDSNRFVFIHRWRGSGERWHHTRLFTANRDGSDLYLLNDFEMTSHFCWLDAATILAWARRGTTDRYHVFQDRTQRTEVLGEGVLTVDGHCTLSPDRKWILTDTYPDKEHYRTLILYRLADGKRFDVARFYSPPEIDGEIRCDLHPRFKQDGTEVCVDSVHTGERQIYAVDVRSIVNS